MIDNNVQLVYTEGVRQRSNCLPSQVIGTIEYRSPSMARYHRLAVRHERQVEIHEAFLQLRCSLICLNYLS
jgi:hypothetical protein